MPTLLEIAEREEIVLFDSTSMRLNRFFDLIYPTRRYADLDSELLTDSLEYIEEFLKFVRQRNIFTVEMVTKDFENIQRIVNAKREFLEESQRRMPPEYQSLGQPKQLLFQSISDNIFELLRLVKSKVFRPEDEELYDRLYYEILAFWYSSPTSLLPVLLERWRQIYAMAFYLSIYQNSVTLVAKSEQFASGLDFLVGRMTHYFPELDLQKYPVILYGKQK